MPPCRTASAESQDVIILLRVFCIYTQRDVAVKILHMHWFVAEDFGCALTAVLAAPLHTPACTEDKELQCRGALGLALCLPKNSVRGHQPPNFQPQTDSLWTSILWCMEDKLACRHLHNFSVYVVLKLLESLKPPHYHCMGTHTQSWNRIISKLSWHSINVPSYC